MAIPTRRREFILALGGAAVTWPVVARAQQAPMPAVGFLHSASVRNYQLLVNAFREGLANAGYVEGPLAQACRRIVPPLHRDEERPTGHRAGRSVV